MKSKNKILEFPNYLADFLTSHFLVTIGMLGVLVGIAKHMINVFDSVFLGCTYQFIVMLTSVNSHLLPKLPGYKTQSIIPYIVSLITFWLVFIDWGGMEKHTTKEFVIILTKSLVVAFMEFIFSFLFTNRNWERIKKIGLIDRVKRLIRRLRAENLHLKKQLLLEKSKNRMYQIQDEIIKLKRSSKNKIKWHENPQTLELIEKLENEYNKLSLTYAEA